MKTDKVYSGAYLLPRGNAEKKLTDGCLVLEGGAFRGVYTNGVIDRLLLAGIKLRTVVGVSAGALNGMCYAAGSIGVACRMNLIHRHDGRYVGIRPLLSDHGIMGYDYLFNDLRKILGFNFEEFNNPEHQLYAAVTNCITGEMEYYEKSSGMILDAIRASASMPFVSRMVMVDGKPCLDGGCSHKIPLDFALNRGYEKIVVVCTRPDGHRRKEKGSHDPARIIYGRYPKLVESMRASARDYNETREKIEEMGAKGRIVVISPSKELNVRRLETGMEKLGQLYHLGFNDTQNRLDELKQYLGSPDII